MGWPPTTAVLDEQVVEIAAPHARIASVGAQGRASGRRHGVDGRLRCGRSHRSRRRSRGRRRRRLWWPSRSAPASQPARIAGRSPGSTTCRRQTTPSASNALTASSPRCPTMRRTLAGEGSGPRCRDVECHRLTLVDGRLVKLSGGLTRPPMSGAVSRTRGRADLVRLGHDVGVIDVADVLQPELTEVNRLPRPPLTPYPDVDSARDGVGTPWRRSLDGAWRFRLVPSPSAAPARWMHPTTSDERWRTIDVPGCWTRQAPGICLTTRTS